MKKLDWPYIILSIILLGMMLYILPSCVTAVPPSPQVQADVSDGIITLTGSVSSASPSPKATRAASQTHDFYGAR